MVNELNKILLKFLDIIKKLIIQVAQITRKHISKVKTFNFKLIQTIIEKPFSSCVNKY